MTDDLKRQPKPRGGKNAPPAEDPFHNVIHFPDRRKRTNNEEPPPPNAA